VVRSIVDFMEARQKNYLLPQRGTVPVPTHFETFTAHMESFDLIHRSSKFIYLDGLSLTPLIYLLSFLLVLRDVSLDRLLLLPQDGQFPYTEMNFIMWVMT
jgi:hypothetical protein